MINIKITGLSEAVNYFKGVSTNIGSYATTGTTEAGHFLVDVIRIKTGNDRYEVMTNESLRTTWVAPSPEDIKDPKVRGKALSIWKYKKCPFWEDLIKDNKDLSGLAIEPEVENIVIESLEEIRNIIVRAIRRGM